MLYTKFWMKHILLFSRAHASVITPILVYRCDESSLISLSSLLPSSSPLPSLLSLSLPSSMALILPSFAQRDSQDSEAESEERRKKAQASHGLLTKHLSEEVRMSSWTEQNSNLKLRSNMCMTHVIYTCMYGHMSTQFVLSMYDHVTIMWQSCDNCRKLPSPWRHPWQTLSSTYYLDSLSLTRQHPILHATQGTKYTTARFPCNQISTLSCFQSKWSGGCHPSLPFLRCEGYLWLYCLLLWWDSY